MKNIKIIIGLLAMAVVWSCDPLEDDIDKINENFAFAEELVVTLTDDDYELSSNDDVQDDKRFDSEDDAKLYIPEILENKYPGLGNGSSAIVTYNFNRGRFVNNSKFLDLDDYQDANSAITLPFFNETIAAEDNLNILAEAKNSDPIDGQIQVFSYYYADAEYADVTYTEEDEFDLFQEDFESYDVDTQNLSDLTTLEAISTVGDQDWYLYASSTPYQAARISGDSGWPDYNNLPNEDWLITEEIDLTNDLTAVLKLTHVVNFLGDGTIGDHISVMVSTDYAGNPATATWSAVVLEDLPIGDSYDRFESTGSLATYGGKKVNIGFRYTSTIDYAPQWRVIDIAVKSVDLELRDAYYKYSFFDEAWEEAYTGDLNILSESDFEIMGLSNFSGDNAADDYLVQFLNQTRAFAQEGDEEIVIYDYVSSFSGAQKRGDVYSFLDGAWVKYLSEIEQALAFGNDGSSWVPDNTVKITLGSDEYAVIAAATLVSNPDGSGSIASYGNFDVSLWASDQIFEAITAYLLATYPSVDGQKYLVTYATWLPGAGTDSIFVVYSEAEGGYLSVEE